MSRLENHPSDFFFFPQHVPFHSQEPPPLSYPPSHNLYQQFSKENSSKGYILPVTKKSLKQFSKQYNSHPVHATAVPILFPQRKEARITYLHAMPENTLKEKIEKEAAFQALLLENHMIKPTIHDHNNGLRAIVSFLHPTIPPESEGATAHLLRGDLIQYILRHPTNLTEDVHSPILSEWYKKMQNKEPISFIEIKALSSMLKTPIEVFSFNQLDTTKKNDLVPNQEMRFGKEYDKPPILLYFDPVHSHFMALIPLPPSF